MPRRSGRLLPALVVACLRPTSAGLLGVDAYLQAMRTVSLASGTAGPSTAGPGQRGGVKVAPQWLADIEYNSSIVGMNFTSGTGWFAYDSPGQRHRSVAMGLANLFYPNGSQYLDNLYKNGSGVLNQNLTMGKGTDGTCVPVRGAYFDIFSWTASARRNGSRVVAGEACDVWTRDMVAPSLIASLQPMRFSACVAKDGVVREFAQTFIGATLTGTMSYRFHNIRLGDPGDGSFAGSYACTRNFPGRPCEDAGVRTISAYRVWAPPEPMELHDRDTGDVMGDLSFLCAMGAGSASYRSKLITLWSVNVSSAFGQYALCNYDGHTNKCAGEPSQLRRVGRRASQYQGQRLAGGQCTRNDDVGSQYSFPSEARCPEGSSPSALGCGWAAPRALRTIGVACLLDRGLLNLCGREYGHAPFRDSIALFEAAFASNDTASGGCPDALPSAGAGTAILI